jgi:hypothetical protein
LLLVRRKGSGDGLHLLLISAEGSEGSGKSLTDVVVVAVGCGRGGCNVGHRRGNVVDGMRS